MSSTPLLPTPTAIIAHLDRFVRGQARAKQDIAVAVYNHYLSQAWRDREGSDLGRYHILMIGPTGVGKTHLVQTLAEFLGVPVGFASATGLVEVGYKGNSVDSIVRALLDRAGGDPRKAEKGIVFLLWTSPPESDVAGYRVYRRVEGAAPERLEPSLIQIPSYRDEKPRSGKRVEYRVTALDRAGNEGEAAVGITDVP